ncbi:MAG: hypothetical protein HZA77_16070 [Candidatus Schekmanbacteria bacterium]|nr:hypothetical protein [Candidatus Schekmanbacteria bacterium]
MAIAICNLNLNLNLGTAPIIPRNWREFLSGDVSKETAEVISCHERTGRPLGSETFIKNLELQLNRSLRKRKPVPKITN